MEFLIELILDLFLDGTLEILPNKKIPKWVRYTLGSIAFALIGAVMLAIFVVGALLMPDMLWAGILFEVVGVVFLVAFIRKCIKIKKQLK